MGLKIVVDKYGYIISSDNKNNKVYLSHGENETFIGMVGGTININTIYSNLLVRNAKKARSIWNPYEFRSLVQEHGEWDYKNNGKTIYGCIGSTSTIFSFNGQNLESQDIGNHHFGVVGKAIGYFSEEYMLRKAGEYQIKSGRSKPEWQIYETVVHGNYISKSK